MICRCSGLSRWCRCNRCRHKHADRASEGQGAGAITAPRIHPSSAPFGLGADTPAGLPCRRIGWGIAADRAPLPHRRAEVAHRWIVARPGITMPVNQLPFAVLPAVDLRDAQA